MDNRIDAIYGRQSIDKKDSISIESQFEFCRYELKGGEAKEYKERQRRMNTVSSCVLRISPMHRLIWMP